MATKSVFITNNGLADRIGVAQILPYLEGLSNKGHKIACVSVEHPSRQAYYHDEIAPRIAQAGILHSPILRHATALAGKLERFVIPSLLLSRLDQLASLFDPDLIHCRSYMPLHAALQIGQRRNIPFVFDMRGFWVDERCESDLWSGPVGRSVARHFRRLEQRALQDADSIVTLTHDARNHVLSRLPHRGADTHVIPCCVDQTAFEPRAQLRRAVRKDLQIQLGDLVLAHLGSTGPLYRMDATYRLLAALRRHGFSVKLLAIGEDSAASHIARACEQGVELSPTEVIAKAVAHHEVPSLLNASDIGLSFRLPSFSSLGASATKVGEYLSCGLPVISNEGVGDIRRILSSGEMGVVLPDLSDGSIEAAANQIATQGFACRQTIRAAAAEFSMTHAINMYDGIYRHFDGLQVAA